MKVLPDLNAYRNRTCDDFPSYQPGFDIACDIIQSENTQVGGSVRLNAGMGIIGLRMAILFTIVKTTYVLLCHSTIL